MTFYVTYFYFMFYVFCISYSSFYVMVLSLYLSWFIMVLVLDRSNLSHFGPGGGLRNGIFIRLCTILICKDPCLIFRNSEYSSNSGNRQGNGQQHEFSCCSGSVRIPICFVCLNKISC